MNRSVTVAMNLLLWAVSGAVALAQGGGGSGGEKRPSPEQLIRQFDRDGDGCIGRDEAPDRMTQRWDELDADKDGFITLDELKARDERVAKGDQHPAGGGGKRETISGYKPAAEFTVITVGSGSPHYDPNRAGPCTTIQCRGRYYVVDMGNGSQARIEDAGVSDRSMDGLLLTHHHLDHNEEFTPLFLHTRLDGGKPEIVGPPGTKDLVDFVRKFYDEDIAYRLRRMGKSADDFAPAVVREVKGGESFDLGPMKVSTAKVNHTIYTVAYRFDLGGQSIVISGDLSYSETLVDLARDADVLVVDSGGAVVRAGETAKEGGPKPGGGADPTRAHSTRDEVIAMAKKSGAKKLVLTHIASSDIDEEATIRSVREGYPGEVIVAHDFLEVVPAAAGHGAGGARIYVKGAVAGTKPDGKGWATAFATVQEGIDAAASQGGGEAWVAAGTYTPTSGADREATFRLRKGVAVYGGFAGQETALDRRDWEKNATILSGDIGRTGVDTDNCYHVVTGADDAVLDGFTICGGCGQEGRGPGGGPMLHTTPDAVLKGASNGSGAGMVNFQCAPTVRNCTFQDNHGGKGGAMYNMVSRVFPPRPDASSAAPAVTNCRFFRNSARGRGGAVANDLGTSPTFRDCVFIGNQCDEKGGALYDDFGCSPTLINCLFAENRAATAGATGNDGGSSPLLVHCTLTRNVASEEGAALYQGTGPSNDPEVVECILWGNECPGGPAEIYDWHDNAPRVTGSCVQGGYPGDGNMDQDPRFVDPARGDYRVAAGSPCATMGYTASTSDDLLARHARRPAAERRPPPAAKPAPKERGAPSRVLYVNAGNAATGDGASWKTAFRSLSAAIAAAGDERVEIRVAAGIYKPTDGADRAEAFRLRSGLDLYGGFVGSESKREEREERDAAAHPTVLSGDIGREGEVSDNAYHVVIGADGAVLDGFTIRDGNADGRTWDGKGGGMINYPRAPQSGPMGAPTGWSPVVRNCVFTHNHAREGGAVYDYDRSTPVFESCRFIENSADWGGAIVDRVGVKSMMTGCLFQGNTARWKAGAVYLDYGSRPAMSKCRFEGNRCDGDGGAIAMVSRASQLENTVALLRGCTFSGNTAKDSGGAIANSDSSILGVDGCTFTDGRAAMGSAIASDTRARSVVLNCTFSGNAAGGGDADLSTDDTSSLSRDARDWPQ